MQRHYTIWSADFEDQVQNPRYNNSTKIVSPQGSITYNISK